MRLALCEKKKSLLMQVRKNEEGDGGVFTSVSDSNKTGLIPNSGACSFV